MKPTKTNAMPDPTEKRRGSSSSVVSERDAPESVNVREGLRSVIRDHFDVGMNRFLPSHGNSDDPSNLGDCFQRRRIILLDDDAVTCRLSALVLARAGYALDTAGDGEQGWMALCTRRYDLLVTDVDMPGLDGLQLIARARKAGLTLPVIVASGSPELGEADEYPSLRIAAILHKPYSIAELVVSARSAVPVARHSGDGTVNCLNLEGDEFPLSCSLMPAAVHGGALL